METIITLEDKELGYRVLGLLDTLNYTVSKGVPIKLYYSPLLVSNATISSWIRVGGRMLTIVMYNNGAK